MSEDPILLPRPRSLIRGAGAARLDGGIRLEIDPGFDAPAARLRARLETRGIGTDGRLPVRLLRRDGDPDGEAYRLSVRPDAIELRAPGSRGAIHGVTTLGQLLDPEGTRVPALEIEDAPALARRGLMLDISRDRVPTQARLLELVDQLEELKLNELQLYTEHTFAYTDHEAVWQHASPLTHDEIRELDRACTAREIELVPNQNSFGHMERWLRHPEYRALGEDPNGGACLCPDAASADFMEGLYGELLPLFRSRRINIGCDETFGLGSGRSAARCEAEGTGRVYLDFLLDLIARLHARERTVLFWGDIVLQHPELIAQLPKRDLVALAWHYEAPADPEGLDPSLLEALARFGMGPERLRGFAGQAPVFQAAEVPFQVCPGTSSWNTFIGRLSNARANLLDAAREGTRFGAEGLLITDWGDNGHMQPPVTSLPPLAYGAGVAWDPDANEGMDLEAALGAHLLENPSLARAALALGDAYQLTGLESQNATPFFVAMRFGLGETPPSWVLRGRADPRALGATVEHIDSTLAGLTGDDPASADLRQAARLARHGTWRLLRRAGAGPDDAALGRDLAECIATQRERWLSNSRPGGLPDSLALLERAAQDYGPGTG